MKKILLFSAISIFSFALASTAMAATQNAAYDSHTGDIYPTGGV